MRAKLPAPVPTEDRSAIWWLRWVPTVVLTLLVLYFLYVIGSVALIPVLASFALAYLLNPVVSQGEKYGLSRPIAAALALLLVTLAVVAFLAFIIPDLWEQSTNAVQKILRNFTPENAARQRETLRRYSPALDRMGGRRIEQFLRNPAEAIGSPGLLAAGGLSSFLSTAVASLDLLIVPFFVFYILIDFGTWRDSMEDLIPPRFRDTFSRLFDEVGRILAAYVRGQLLIALCMAVLYAIGFFALGVPAWAGLAALAGLLNAIPYVGTILGLGLAGAFTLADGGGLWRIAGIVGVFVIVQSIEGYILTPRILGKRLSLHPMAVFLGLLIGGKLFGLLGVILAVPTIAVAKVFLKFLRELYTGSYFYHAGDISAAEAPSPVLEERLADAAETVLAEQVGSESGEELLATDKEDDDAIAREDRS
ncbi:MAG: AI-2E family transporter [Acidobacteriota bacterium]|nr:AI-2E family transporter [Acidobacteriota bacterium]